MTRGPFYHAEFTLLHEDLDLSLAELTAKLIPLLNECRLWDVAGSQKLKIVIETVPHAKRMRITVEPVPDDEMT